MRGWMKSTLTSFFRGADDGLYRASFWHRTGWWQRHIGNGAISHPARWTLAVVVRPPAESALAPEAVVPIIPPGHGVPGYLTHGAPGAAAPPPSAVPGGG